MNFNPQAVKAIIFDFGGTLDTNGIHWSHLLRDAWDSAGVAANDALFREAYVYGEQELERESHILPTHDFADLISVKAKLELLYLSQNGHFPPAEIEKTAGKITEYCKQVILSNIEKVKPTLLKLSSKYPLVLVSNFYGNLGTVVKGLGISQYFKKIIDSYEVKIRKPDSAIFKLAISYLGVPASEVLVVGDSYRNDIQPAGQLGCNVLWLKGKGWDDEETAVDKDIDVISSIDGILDKLA